MKCIECGHELKDGAIFCIRCGAMQVSMDGKPIERGEDWPTVDAQTDGSAFRSSTAGALHSAQAKNPRGFQPAPQRNGGKIAAVIIALLAIIAIAVFALTQCTGQATSGSDTSSAAVQATTSGSAQSTSAASTTSSTSSTSAASTSASAASASASASATSGTSASADAPAAQPAQQETQPAQEEEEAPSYSGNDYYVLPSSDSYYYSYDELSGMSTWDLYLARNEIYARHGRMFNRSDLQDYFNSQDWYEPIYTPSQFDSMGDENVLSDVELKNARLMRQVEADKGSSYL